MALLFTLLLGVVITIEVWFNHNDSLRTLGVFLTALVIVGSYIISIFVVQRTNQIASLAENIIATGDLSQRIRHDSRWDDLGRMAAVLNNFLARNEQQVQAIRQVSDNIAHDMRTPLARLCGNLESLRSHPELQETEFRAITEKLILEADHLIKTFNALLRIARIEAIRDTSHFQPVKLALLVKDVLELYEPLLEEKRITLLVQLDETVTMQADRDLLFQALANLLDNAWKFTPQGGRIEVVVGGKEQPILTISDSGPGIPAADMSQVSRRFYRGESSRTTPGNGLGLSLVDAVLGIHNARKDLHNTFPGLRVRLSFPANFNGSVISM